MARTKNYEAHISNLQAEIESTTKKLATLNEQMTSLLKEKEENEVTALYQYIRANNISMKDIVKTFKSDKDTNANTSTQNKTPRAKSQTAQSRSRKTNTKTLSNETKKRNSRSKKENNSSAKSL